MVAVAPTNLRKMITPTSPRRYGTQAVVHVSRGSWSAAKDTTPPVGNWLSVHAATAPSIDVVEKVLPLFKGARKLQLSLTTQGLSLGGAPHQDMVAKLGMVSVVFPY